MARDAGWSLKYSSIEFSIKFLFFQDNAITLIVVDSVINITCRQNIIMLYSSIVFSIEVNRLCPFMNLYAAAAANILKK